MRCPAIRTGRSTGKETRWGLRFGTGDAQRSGGGFVFFFGLTPRPGSSSVPGSMMKIHCDRRAARAIRTRCFSTCLKGAIRPMTGPHWWQQVEPIGCNGSRCCRRPQNPRQHPLRPAAGRVAGGGPRTAPPSGQAKKRLADTAIRIRNWQHIRICPVWLSGLQAGAEKGGD